MSATASSDAIDLLNRLAEDFVRRLRAGEQVSVTEYTQAYPHLGERIRKLFPALVAVEHAAEPPKPAPEPVPAPHQLGHYQLLRELGRGGMGVVYEAVQAPLGRHVALKVLSGRSFDARAVQRFRREAEVAARLHHTNIVPIFEAGQEGDVCYYAMQYIRGWPLHEVIAQQRGYRLHGRHESALAAPHQPLLTGRAFGDDTPPNGSQLAAPALVNPCLPRHEYHRRVADLGVQVAAALAYAHERGVFHRDVKPSNLLLDHTGTVWVTDFGLVKTQDSDLTTTGALVGTLRYLAPERLMGRCDARSDVYALGLTLYELLTLEPAFGDTDHMRLLQAIPGQVPAAIRQRERSIPNDLETVVLKAMHKNPARRYQSAGDLAEDLRRFLAGDPVHARRVGLLERTWGWAKHHPALAVVCGAAVVVAALLAWTAQDAVRHASQLGAALSQTRHSELAAREAETRARAGETKALEAKHRTDQLAAQLKFAGALTLANEGNIDRALFEMVQALRLAPEDENLEPFRRVVRRNLTAWSAQTARLRFAFRLPGKVHEGPLPWAGVDARAGFISSGGTKGTFVTFGPDLHVREWSFGDGAPVGRPFLLPTNQMYDLPFSVSPDGRWLATWGRGGQWFDLGTGKALPDRIHHVSRVGRTGGVTYPMFTEEPSVFMTTGDDPEDVGFYRFWDTKTKKEYPVTLRLGSGDSYQVMREASGRALLVVAREGRGPRGQTRLKVWDLASGKPCALPVQPAAPVGRPKDAAGHGGFVCLPRGENLRGPTWLDGDRLIQRWDLATIGRPAGRAWRLPCATWYRFLTANDSVLVTQGRDTRLRLFDVDTGRQLGGNLSVPTVHVPDVQPLSLGLAVAPDGAALVTVGRDGIVRGWDVAHLVEEATAARQQAPCHFPVPPEQGPAGPVVALSADGSRAFFGGAGVGRLVDARTGATVGPPRQHPGLNAAVLSPDGTYLATATLYSPRQEPPVVCLWDGAGGEPLLKFCPPAPIYGLRFSPDGRLLAVGCWSRTVVLDVALKQVRHTLADTSSALDLAFSPDSRRLAVGYRGGYGGSGAGVRVWDLDTGKPAGPLRNGWSWWAPAQPLGFVSGGDSLVVLDPDVRKLTRLDVAAGTYRATDLEVQLPQQLATASRALVAVSNGSGSIELWDVLAQQRRALIASGTEILRLHFSGDGKTLAALCSDDAVRLWDTATALPLGPPLYHPAPVAALAFSADGQELTTAVRTGRLYRWPLPAPMLGGAEECKRLLAARLGIAFTSGEGVLLTPEEWNRRRER